MHAHKRKQVIKGRGAVGKTAVVGAKDRATNRVSAAVVKNVDQPTLQGFVAENVEPGTKVYTDDHGGYEGLLNHETVRHSVKEYVNGQAHTNGIESFWAMLKRGYVGKPLALLDRIIKASSNAGDVVLDPFAGCATACVSAETLGRQWVGIDLSELAATLVKTRLKEAFKLFYEGAPPRRRAKAHGPRQAPELPNAQASTIW